MTVTNSTFSANQATSGLRLALIVSAFGTLTVTNSTFSANQAGGCGGGGCHLQRSRAP